MWRASWGGVRCSVASSACGRPESSWASRGGEFPLELDAEKAELVPAHVRRAEAPVNDEDEDATPWAAVVVLHRAVDGARTRVVFVVRRGVSGAEGGDVQDRERRIGTTSTGIATVRRVSAAPLGTVDDGVLSTIVFCTQGSM